MDSEDSGRYRRKKERASHVLDSDMAFQKFAKEIGNEYKCYFVALTDGAYELRRYCNADR